jgi:FKBP-type peptidyl-prolyl cis-trans isomerase FkpA
MKQTIFTLLLLSLVIGLVSCRKKNSELNIRQYDDQQILNYISSHGLTKMIKDTSGGDTTGMYYQILTPGNPAQPLNDTDKISAVFSLSSFDGLYTSSDTIENHFCNYIGHIATQGLPAGLRIAILSDLKYNGGSMRILIPSRMAYGLNGTGSGSKENANSHIAGNQCLDYYVHLINNEPAYDDLVIQNYIKSQSLTGYIKTKSSTPDSQYYYYKISKIGNGTNVISQNSIVEAVYTGLLLDNVVFDNSNTGADSVSLQIPNLVQGVQEGLTHATGGDWISLILPSGLAYGQNSTSGNVTVSVNSCLRFNFQIISITN